MPISVTLDSNVFRPISRPSLFPGNPEISAIQTIHDAIKAKEISAYVAETMVDLEAIEGKDRAAYFSGLSAKISTSENVLENDSIKLSIGIKPDTTAHLGLNKYFSEPIEAALEIGVRFLRCPRIGLPRPVEIDDNWFAIEKTGTAMAERQELFFEVGREIESRGVGIATIKDFANNLGANSTDEPWYKYLQCATEKAEFKAIHKAVGEWADGDAIAAHIGYEIDYFCTLDEAKGAGVSILDTNNRSWLQTEYKIQIVTPTELAKIITR